MEESLKKQESCYLPQALLSRSHFAQPPEISSCRSRRNEGEAHKSTQIVLLRLSGFLGPHKGWNLSNVTRIVLLTRDQIKTLSKGQID